MRKADKRAVFFDRDGTIIYDLGYPRELEKIQLLPGVGEALFELKQRGFCLVLVSNQSGIGRGIAITGRWG
jgi:D-glycero-D-manno-heptose 1,7-bisphosphate phosphatase